MHLPVSIRGLDKAGSIRFSIANEACALSILAGKYPRPCQDCQAERGKETVRRVPHQDQSNCAQVAVRTSETIESECTCQGSNSRPRQVAVRTAATWPEGGEAAVAASVTLSAAAPSAIFDVM